MILRWFGQSAFLLTGSKRVLIDPFAPALGERLAERGISFRHPPVAGVTADLVLVTHEHSDHNAVEGADGFAHELGYSSDHPVPPDARSAARIEDLLSGPTLKLLVRTSAEPTDGTAFVDALVDVVGDLAVVADSGAHGLGEISGPGVTKAAGLARWAATQGIDRRDV